VSAWWRALAPRERLALGIGGVVVALALGFALVVDPLLQSRARLAADVLAMERDLAWMRTVASDAGRRGQLAAGSRLDRGGRSLLALVDASAREAGLGAGIKRVEPVGNGRVMLWIEASNFDALARWLEALGAQYGITVDEMVLDRGAALGAVDGRLTLADPPGQG
jgi:general secretion pathway protein M